MMKRQRTTEARGHREKLSETRNGVGKPFHQIRCKDMKMLHYGRYASRGTLHVSESQCLCGLLGLPFLSDEGLQIAQKCRREASGGHFLHRSGHVQRPVLFLGD